jgi:hypothetical protein
MADSNLSSNQFYDLKGDIGEQLFASVVRDQMGLLPFRAPYKFEQWDFVLISTDADNNQRYKPRAYVDVKTKPRRLKYPDTGLDVVSYKRLIHIAEAASKWKIPVWVVFVDYIEKALLMTRDLLKTPTHEVNGNGCCLKMFYLNDLERYKIGKPWLPSLEEIEKESESRRPYKYGI